MITATFDYAVAHSVAEAVDQLRQYGDDAKLLAGGPPSRSGGAYMSRGTGEIKIRRFLAIDDCGNIINPMIVEGQIHGGLTMGLGPSLMEEISYDEDGNMSGGSFMDYLVPTAVETPAWETDKTCTPSPHHPFGAKGVGESATVGSPPAIVNAVVDALSHLGVRHIDIPMTPDKIYRILEEHGLAEP